MVIENHAAPLLVHNVIHEGRSGGVLIRGAGTRGRLEANDLYGTEQACVAVVGGADPTIVGNRYGRGREGGGEGGSPCTTAGHLAGDLAKSGILRGGASTCTPPPPLHVRTRRIYGCRSAGIRLMDDGTRGMIEKNDIWDNARAGIYVESGADPFIIGNEVHEGQTAGILICNRGKGRIVSNDVWGNKLAGLSVENDGDPVIIGNRLHDGLSAGIFVSHSKGRFEKNEVRCNKDVGIILAGASTSLVLDNSVRDGLSAGVLIRDPGTTCRLIGNDISGNKLTGVCVALGSEPSIQNNKIHDGQTTGLYVCEPGTKGRIGACEHACIGVDVRTSQKGTPCVCRP